jgi:NAD(P)-dependent dehydrogenase (short-subunit alcohol dehydrogenase family)
MRVLVLGDDVLLERALRDRGFEPVRDEPADSLVTMAPGPLLRPLADISAEEWKARFESCVAKPFWVFQAWLRDVLARGATGRWVAITVGLGSLPFPGGGADATSAVALQTLVRIAAIEYGQRGIRANAIAAGWREQTLPDELDGRLAIADTPTGRLVSARDISAAVGWLLSPEAEQLNGEVLHLDGGYAITRGSRPNPYRP